MSWIHKPHKRSLPCVGSRVKHFRLLRGWTQEEFASVAGYTPRLIAKAEGGGSLKTDTIEDLAAALSTAEAPISPDDLISSPKAIVRQYLEDFALHEKDCVVKCQHLIDDDIVSWAPGNPDIIPFAGEHLTIDGFDQMHQGLFSLMERIDKKHMLNSMQLFEEGNKVICLTSEIANMKNRRRSAVSDARPFPLCYLFTVEEGKITRFEDHFDSNIVEALIQLQRG